VTTKEERLGSRQPEGLKFYTVFGIAAAFSLLTFFFAEEKERKNTIVKTHLI